MSYTFSAAGLPPGLALVGNTVTGTPTATGSYSVTFTVSDGVSSASETVNVTIAAVPVPLPFWQLILAAEDGVVWSDSARAQLLVTAETGSYWLDSTATQPPPPTVIAEAGIYWLDSAVEFVTPSSSSGSYWGDSVEVDGLEPETIALLARFAGTYDDARQAAIDAFILSMKTGDGTPANATWDTIDDLLIFAAPVSSDALLNWKGTSFTAAAVNSPNFVVDRGFTGNGSSSYLDTNYNPATAAGQLTQNSATIGAYIRTNVTEARADMGCVPGNFSSGLYFLSRHLNGIFARVNQGSNSVTGSSIMTSAGLTLATRTGATANATYKNGALVQAFTAASVSPPSFNILVGAINTGGTPSEFPTKQYAAAVIASGWTAGQSGAFYTALQTYLSTYSANV